MGVVVRRYIDILTIILNFPYSTCIRSFIWQQHPYFFVHLKKNCFSVFNLHWEQMNKRGVHVPSCTSCMEGVGGAAHCDLA